MKNILIIGDWLVDEHWIMGVHRSSTSSRVGQNHFRGLQTADCALQSFCGAGQTASVLLRAQGDEEKNFCNLLGVGIWHKKDTPYLTSMLNQNLSNIVTPYRQYYGGAVEPDSKDTNASLLNIADGLTFSSCK